MFIQKYNYTKKYFENQNNLCNFVSETKSLNMKRLTSLTLALFAVALCVSAKTERISSPNGTISIDVNIGTSITMNVFNGSELIFKDTEVGVQVGNEELGVNPKLANVKRTVIDEQIRPVVPMKYAIVDNCANQLRLNFKGNYSLEVRAYDNGFAYRFVLNRKGDAEITDETLNMSFPTPFTAHISKTNSFVTSYEEPYSHLSTAELKTDEMTHLPVLFESGKGTMVLFSETDVRDYPAMFLKSTDSNQLSATYPKTPAKWEQTGDRGMKVTQEEQFIARTNGARALPWRFAVIGDDATIASNQMEAILGGKCEITDTSWIKPGKVAWDWWNSWAVWDVDFTVGINNDTYKYFIDFASDYGIEYILLDEGWCTDVEHPFSCVKGIDVKELVEYGREKNVGVILWVTWLAVENNMNLIEHYADMGVKGLKIDFMDHSNQYMVNFYERVTKECAKNHLLVDFHGAFKPAGLEHRYPNLLSYEGVRGLEYNRNCLPENSIWQPFMRNAVGAMDFTPGAMITTQPEQYGGTREMTMGMGTRAYQMALYVCFESGIQMLADSPTRYMREEECARFIASVPVTWDDTRVLKAKAGDYYVVAKRKSSKWYIGAISDENERDITIDLSFLEKEGILTSFEDGKNANRTAIDYRKRTQKVMPSTTLTIHLARNGGWCGVID